MHIFKMSSHNLEVSFETPVHIGNGETITRFDYYFNEEKRSVSRVNTLNFILSLPENEKVALSKLNFEEPSGVFNVFDEIYQRNLEILRKNIIWITGVTGAFIEKYKNLSNESQREIKVLIRSGLSMKPYLPGSSLKGSIATAILYYLRKESLITEEQYKKFAKKAMIGDSPDRALGRVIKVSDSLNEEKLKSYVFYISRVRAKNPKNASGLYQFADCLYRCNSRHEVTFLTFPEVPNSGMQAVETFGLEINKEFLIDVCNRYYGEVLMPEIIRKIGEKNVSKDFMNLHDRFKSGKLNRNQFLLQIGWGGGIEGITLLDKKSGTVWVVQDEEKKLLPLGWCIAEFKD